MGQVRLSDAVNNGSQSAKVATGLLFLAVFLVGGCATVKPYEREHLARRDMQFEGNPDGSAGEQHAVAYREGSSGGFGASGGGCGCN